MKFCDTLVWDLPAVEINEATASSYVCHMVEAGEPQKLELSTMTQMVVSYDDNTCKRICVCIEEEIKCPDDCSFEPRLICFDVTNCSIILPPGTFVFSTEETVLGGDNYDGQILHVEAFFHSVSDDYIRAKMINKC